MQAAGGEIYAKTGLVLHMWSDHGNCVNLAGADIQIYKILSQMLWKQGRCVNLAGADIQINKISSHML